MAALQVQRSTEERDRMVEQYLPLVRYVVARLVGNASEFGAATNGWGRPDLPRSFTQ